MTHSAVTWKEGDFYFTFVDAVDCMLIREVMVHHVTKRRTEVRSRTGRAVVDNPHFLKYYATTRRAAVELAIAKTKAEARFHQGVVESKKALAASYQAYLNTVKDPDETPPSV